MKSLFEELKLEMSNFFPYLNTGLILDITTGSFINGLDGHMVLNGGLGLTNASIGRPQSQKSTTSLSHVINAFARLYGVEMMVYDTERALSLDRIFSLCNIPLTDEQKDNVILMTQEKYTLEEFYANIKTLADKKMENRKSYTMEMPIRKRSGEGPIKMLRPTFVVIDSWSKATTAKTEEMLTSKVDIKNDQYTIKKSITDSSTNTVYMKEGLDKKKTMGMLSSLAEKAGIYFFFTSHVGDKFELDTYNPTPKTLQFMRGKDKPTNTGSSFLFLVSTLLDNRGSKTLLDDTRKNPLYPSKRFNMSKDEIQEVQIIQARCKNNTSGQSLPCIISQSKGISSSLTYYHYLKENKYYGFDGGQRTHQLYLKKDVNISRTTIYDLCYGEDEKFKRALEITGINLYIKNNWYFDKITSPFGIDIKDLAERLEKKKLLDRVLKSRGWLTNEHPKNPWCKIEYLSYLDILNLVF